MLDFSGLAFVSAGLERTILYAYPTIVAIIGFVFFRERLTFKHLLALGLTYLGLIVSLGSEIRADANPGTVFGALLIILCTITYSVYVIASKPFVDRYGALRFTSYAILTSTFALLLHALFFVSPSAFIVPEAVYKIAFGMAILATVLPNFALSFGIGRLGPSTAAVIRAGFKNKLSQFGRKLE